VLLLGRHTESFEQVRGGYKEFFDASNNLSVGNPVKKPKRSF
jgi:hypothetical protein